MDLEQSLKFTDAQARVLERERIEREQIASERKREAAGSVSVFLQ